MPLERVRALRLLGIRQIPVGLMTSTYSNTFHTLAMILLLEKIRFELFFKDVHERKNHYRGYQKEEGDEQSQLRHHFRYTRTADDFLRCHH